MSNIVVAPSMAFQVEFKRPRRRQNRKKKQWLWPL